MSDFKYFDIEPILSRNALVTCVISSRGAGKTYSSKKRIIRRFKKHGERFLFLKRTEEELKATVGSFWDDFADAHVVFKHESGRYFIGDRTIEHDEEGNEKEVIDWQLFGYSAALSTTAKLKGISPQNVGTILWDEFVAYDGRYLRDEGQRLLDTIETVDRMKDSVRVICTGNKNENGFYPVLHELGCPQSSNFEDNKIYTFKSGTIVVYSFTNEAYIKAKSKTRLGKLARNTDYYETMVLNKNESQFSELVMKKPRHANLVFSVASKGDYFNVYWVRISKDVPTGIYIEPVQKPQGRIYTTDNVTPTLPKLAGNGYQMLYTFMTSGMARFDTQVTAQKLIEAIISKRK